MKKILSLLLLLGLNGCSLLWYGRYGRMPLSLKRQDYVGAEIKTNGIYYNEKFGNFFLYKNGIYLDGGTAWSSLENLLHEVTPILNKFSKDTVFDWGLFEIRDSNVVIEQWITSSDWGWGRYETKKYYGKIINDSTINIQNYPTGQLFHFHAMPVKPDSLNVFITD